MSNSIPEHYKEIANSMGISLYQRFTLNEASLFLRCQLSEVEQLVASGSLAYIDVSKTVPQFFGYQLLSYLLEHVTENIVPTVSLNSIPERILRAKEVVEMVGLSRTTLWRMEKTGDFPARVSLGVGSVGWRYSEVSEWMNKRGNI